MAVARVFGAGNENFPVASWLCPPQHRPAVMALYRYARTADDIADEGDAAPADRLADLADYRQTLDAVLADPHGSAAEHCRWPQVFGPLAASHAHWHWPAEPLHHLLDAFEADVRHQPMHNDAALLAYCQRSANPVGRLLLHLMRTSGAKLTHGAEEQSDALCTALQLVNFWQDLAEDLARGRRYLPQTTRVAAGPAGTASALRLALLHELARAETLLAQGAPLAWTLSHTPGTRRWGWELRAIVQGGALRLRQLRQALLSGWPLWQQALPRSRGFAAQTLLLARRWPMLKPLPSPLISPLLSPTKAKSSHPHAG
ncbi:squalene/phytoene synthase family protein [Amphibiibacter pelophylacis]|uniref:Squalene/phytoene synthase family protein n=1 Tax=Amphibiibacter pelophylacis TaxID=1799477 RepID=A0ACC6P1F6_9BURK